MSLKGVAPVEGGRVQGRRRFGPQVGKRVEGREVRCELTMMLWPGAERIVHVADLDVSGLENRVIEVVEGAVAGEVDGAAEGRRDVAESLAARTADSEVGRVQKIGLSQAECLGERADRGSAKAAE